MLKGSLISLKVVINDFYILQGSANKIATNVEQSLDSATIWHRRLGHISEKCLNILAKQGVFGNEFLGSLIF